MTWSLIAKIIRWFIPLAIIITMLCGLIYLAVQQNYRQSANDPQIQIAQDAAAALAKGQSPQSLLPQSVDIAKSLSPYIIIFNEQGQPIASSAILDGQIPKLPDGVLQHAKQFGENRLTWQPRPDTRSAIVIDYYQGKNSGFVLAGRNLREVERREEMLELHVIAAWITTLATTLIAIIFIHIVFPTKKAQ